VLSLVVRVAVRRREALATVAVGFGGGAALRAGAMPQTSQ
jgi:hypothetical protein